MKTKALLAVCNVALGLLSSAQMSMAQSAFTYQGKLEDGGRPATGLYDMTFSLHVAGQGGEALNSPLAGTVAVTNGLFTVLLDFGSGDFNGSPRYLEVAVRPAGSGMAHTPLQPRTLLTATPYAIYAHKAAAVGSGAVSAGQLNTPAPPGAGQVLVFDGANLNWQSAGWSLSGNASTGMEFLGTINNQPLNLRANNARALVLASASRTTVSGSIQRTYNTMNVVAGSSANSVSNDVIGATIAGGGASGSTVSGVNQSSFRKPNVVISDFGTIGGGMDNRVGTAGLPDLGVGGTVAGGSNNWVGGRYGVISGGQDNRIGEHDSGTIGGGFQNSVSKSGMFFGSSFGGTVPGGAYNEASANYTFAAGFRAKARHDGSFVWADQSGYDFVSTANNQFSARSTGGARFITAIDGSGNPTAGVRLEGGWTSWGAISDRNAKKNFRPMDGREVLSKLAQVPVSTWNYHWEDTNATPHIGPMAQDFKAAFYPGRDDTIITTLEFDGVELAAIKGLHGLIEEKNSRLAALEDEVTRLTTEVSMQQQTLARWETRFMALEQLVSRTSPEKTMPALISGHEDPTSN